MYIEHVGVNTDDLTNFVLARIRRYRGRDRFNRARPNRISQTELAKMIGVSRTTIANIENNRQQLTIPMLYQICSALDVPVADVLPKVSEVAIVDAPTVRVAGEEQALRPAEAAVAKRIEELRRRKMRERGQP